MAKAVCKICGYSAHDLKPHFIGGKEESCLVTLADYLATYPEGPVESEAFQRELAKLRKKAVADGGLTIRKYNIKETFGIEIGGTEEIIGFVERTAHVPEIDPEYKFPKEATAVALLGLMTNRPTLTHGPTGSGKSSLWEQIAARINWPVLRVNHSADMYSCDITGQKVVENGQTTFQYGPLPFAMQQAMILILDEWDAVTPEVGFLYQSVLERRPDGNLGTLVLTSNGGEKIHSHKYFRMVATSNTAGLGDDKGLYQGTQLQNMAFISRFLLRVKLDYMGVKDETAILAKKFKDLAKEEASNLAKVAKAIRTQFDAGELNAPFSIRDLINWADLYMMVGSAEKAIDYAYSSVLPFNDKKSISEIVQRHFG